MGSSNRGYTLIEITVVIAIVSLLLAGLLAFISTAQQASRDGQRKDGVSKTQIALEQWASTHSGTFLSGANTVRVGQLYSGAYLGQDVKRPTDGGLYTDNGDSVVDASEMVIRSRSGGSSGVGYCVRVRLENGSIYGATDADKTGRINPC